MSKHSLTEMKELFDARIRELQNESSTLIRRIGSISERTKGQREELDQLTQRYQNIITSGLNGIKPRNFKTRFDSLTTQVEIHSKNIDLKKIDSQVERDLKLILEHKQSIGLIKGQLRIIQKEIDNWLKEKIGRKDRLLHRSIGSSSNDIKPIQTLKENMEICDFSSRRAMTDINNLTVLIQTTAAWYPQPIAEVCRTLSDLIGQLVVSSSNIQSNLGELEILNSGAPPSNLDEWAIQIEQFFKERETSMYCNLQLTEHEIILISDYLFDDFIVNNGLFIDRIEHERIAIKALHEALANSIDFTIFDVGRRKKKQQNSDKFEQAVKKWIHSIFDESKIEHSLQLIEDRRHQIDSCKESIWSGMGNKIQKHFKNDFFSALTLSAYGIPEGKFIVFYKKDWHRYPNFHLEHESIATSDFDTDELDKLIKTPIKQRLFSLCLKGEITREQAIMLQEIDKDGSLLEMVLSHAFSFDLLFALHGKENREWYQALIDYPTMSQAIEELRHETFNPYIWDCLTSKKLEVWQYRCIVNLDFEKNEIFIDLRDSDDVWSELTEFYVNMYDKQDQFTRLLKLYQPSAQKDTEVLSLSDIVDAAKQVSNVTIKEKTYKSKKKKRKKRGRYSF